MAMLPRTLRSRKFWIGALTGTVAGSWALRKVGVSLPRVNGG